MRTYRDVAGLDATFIKECVNELEEGHYVEVRGCKNVAQFIAFLEDEIGIEVDYEHNAFGITLIPAEFDFAL